MASRINKNLQYYKFCLYGFFKNLRFFDAFLILFFLSEDLTYVQIGVLYSVKEIIMVIAEIPGGVIADAMGRKKIMVLSFITYIGSFLIFYFAGSFFAFMLAMVVFSLGDSFRTGVHKAMIYHYLKVHGKEDQKVNYYGHTRSWSQTGTAISSLVAGFLVLYTDSYRIIYLASIVPYILDLLLLMSYPSYLDGEKHSFAPKRIIIEFKTVIKDFWDSLKSWRMIKTMTNTSLYTGYYRAIKDYYQPLLKSLALALPVMASLNEKDRVAIIVGIFYFLAYILTALASRNSGVFVDLFKNPFKPMNLTLIAGFTVGLIAGIFFISGWVLAAVIVFILILVIENLRKPIGVALVAELSNEKAYATVLSTTSQAKSLFSALLALIIGVLAEYFNPGVSIAATSLLLLLSLPMYWLSGKNQ